MSDCFRHKIQYKIYCFRTCNRNLRHLRKCLCEVNKELNRFCSIKKKKRKKKGCV